MIPGLTEGEARGGSSREIVGKSLVLLETGPKVGIGLSIGVGKVSWLTVMLPVSKFNWHNKVGSDVNLKQKILASSLERKDT